MPTTTLYYKPPSPSVQSQHVVYSRYTRLAFLSTTKTVNRISTASVKSTSQTSLNHTVMELYWGFSYSGAARCLSPILTLISTDIRLIICTTFLSHNTYKVIQYCSPACLSCCVAHAILFTTYVSTIPPIPSYQIKHTINPCIPALLSCPISRSRYFSSLSAA